MTPKIAKATKPSTATRSASVGLIGVRRSSAPGSIIASAPAGSRPPTSAAGRVRPAGAPPAAARVLGQRAAEEPADARP